MSISHWVADKGLDIFLTTVSSVKSFPSRSSCTTFWTHFMQDIWLSVGNYDYPILVPRNQTFQAKQEFFLYFAQVGQLKWVYRSREAQEKSIATARRVQRVLFLEHLKMLRPHIVFQLHFALPLSRSSWVSWSCYIHLTCYFYMAP